MLKEEKLQILKMVEEGKISVEEGLDLLNALEEKETVKPNKNEIGRASCRERV